MTLYDRYINGETEEVYKEIYALGQEAFLPTNLPEIEKVLTETFQRVAYNLDIIYKELKSVNYLFKENPEYNFEKPLHKPLPDTELLLEQLDNAVKPFGFVPLSLKFFYKIVGGVNFVWDYETNEDFMWEMADPIQIASLDSVVEEITYEYWEEEIQQYVDDEEFGCAFLNLSADDLHKDNVSGGQAYAIKITSEPTIDSKFMNEPNDTTFINYLRICFEYCGFPSITRPDMNNDYQTFFDKVKPKLKRI
ncbi:Knr4/Smi1-like domain-containing protein [Flavobacterium branchiophilum]|uniref:Uncharacterized protein n=1 Tax=Flavobacterium branchiophilum (strain FL-15) TaxID=1034807 RepID=G2YZV2_FLABF|nr:hypothetical protein [Flavobacterium branchiophilum]CCB69205.1 Hypothetical protein FBFL15_1116 [Flavobacterium branchiophilum FL-15]